MLKSLPYPFFILILLLKKYSDKANIAWVFAIVFSMSASNSWGQTNPTPHNLATNWTFTGWHANVPTGSFPGNGATGTNNTTGVVAGAANANMVFWVHSTTDPTVTTNFTGDWGCRYNYTSRSRIQGVGSNGVVLTNAGNRQTVTCCDNGTTCSSGTTISVGNAGAAVLALNSTGRENIQVAWTARLILQEPRGYALRLQYRTNLSGGANANWQNFSPAVEYSTVGKTQGTSENFTTTLPAACNNLASFQVRWVYYYTGPNTGARPEIALDEITVSSSPVSCSVTNISGLSGNCGDASSAPSWTHASCYDEYLVVAKANSAVTGTPTGDGSSYTANSTFGSGTAFGGGFVVYKGSGTSAGTITNLANGTTYFFKVFSRKGTTWSSGVETNCEPAAAPGGPCLSEGFNSGITPPAGWTFTGITGTYTTTGNFGLSSPSLRFDDTNDRIETPTLSGKAVQLSFWIKGQGTNSASGLLVEGFNGSSWVTVENITNSLPTTGTVKTYNSATTPALPGNLERFRFTYSKNVGNLSFDDVTVYCCDGSSPTVLERGDMAVIGLNGNDFSCSGIDGDVIHLVFFKDINSCTELDLTDNGWERVNANQWGNTEGTIRAIRTGGTITAGTVVTFTNSGNAGMDGWSSNDNGWLFVNLNCASCYLNMNSGGDQLYIMQGGMWNPGTFNSHNATYTGGRVLYGFNTRSTWAADGTTQQSNLYPGLDCFNLTPGSATDFLKYTGPTGTVGQREWIARLATTSNWTTYSNCSNYHAGSPNYSGSYSLSIGAGGFTAGVWGGWANTDWFNCLNWENLELPDQAVNVLIPNTTHKPVIGAGVAQCNNLTVNSGGNLTMNNTSSVLEVHGNWTNNSGNIQVVNATFVSNRV